MSHAIQLHIQIHQAALEVSARYQRTESDLIEVLEQVENHKVYLHYNYTSLFQYGVQCLHLSESVVYNLIAVMRKTKEVPALRTQLKEGKIHLSNARKIAPVITVENQDEWLKKASELSQRELEKEVIKIRPKSAVVEKASYVTESRVKLEVGLFEKDMMKLRRVQDLLSQSRSAAANLEDTLIEMTEFYLKHKDPVLKAKRVFVKKGFQDLKNSNTKHANTTATTATHQSPAQPVSLQESNPPDEDHHLKHVTSFKRVPTPASILHQVNLRDQRRCTYTHGDGDSQKRCNQSRWTEIHHIIPVNQGGDNTLSNLTTLCSIHHQWVHSKMNC